MLADTYMTAREVMRETDYSLGNNNYLEKIYILNQLKILKYAIIL